MANVGEAINAAKKAGQKVSSFYSKRAMKTGAYKTAKFNMRSARSYAKAAGANTKGIGNKEVVDTLRTQKNKIIAKDAAIGGGVVAAGLGIKKMRKKNSV